VVLAARAANDESDQSLFPWDIYMGGAHGHFGQKAHGDHHACVGNFFVFTTWNKVRNHKHV
jgi:hypothetical protein